MVNIPIYFILFLIFVAWSVLLFLAGSGITEALVNNKTALAVMRIIYGIGGNGCILATFVLAAESTLPQYSVLITTVPGIGFHIGEFLLAITAYFIRDWKTLQLAIHIPALLFCGLYFIIPESARWLNSKGTKLDQVCHILNQRAKINKKHPIPEKYFDPVVPKEEATKKKLSLQESLAKMLSHGQLLRMSLNSWFQCFCGFFAYYGTLYSSTSLSGDPHINFMLGKNKGPFFGAKIQVGLNLSSYAQWNSRHFSIPTVARSNWAQADYDFG